MQTFGEESSKWKEQPMRGPEVKYACGAQRTMWGQEGTVGHVTGVGEETLGEARGRM